MDSTRTFLTQGDALHALHLPLLPGQVAGVSFTLTIPTVDRFGDPATGYTTEIYTAPHKIRITSDRDFSIYLPLVLRNH